MGLVIINSLVTGAIYALTALGVVMVYKTTRVFNFAHGILSGLCGYVAYQVTVIWGMPFLLGVVTAVLLGAALGYLMEKLLLSRLYQRSALELVIATFGVAMILEYVIIRTWRYDERAIPVPWDNASFGLGGLRMTYYGLTVVGVALVVGAVLTVVLLKSEIGLKLRSTFEDPVAARLTGINVNRIRSSSWALGGGLGGLAGALIAPLLYLSPGSMNSILITAFAAAVIGGFSSLFGAAVGGLAVALTLNIAGTYISLQYRNVILYVVVILFLWIRPHGIFGKAETEHDSAAAEGERSGRLAARLKSALAGRGSRLRGRPAHAVLQLVLVVLVLFAPLILGSSWRLSLGTWLITFIAVAGVALIINYTKQMSLAQSAFVGLGAYATAIVVDMDGSKWWLGMLIAFGAGLVIAAIISIGSARLQGPYFAAMTLALALALPELAQNWGELTGGANGRILSAPSFGGLQLTSSQMYTFVAIFALVVFVGLIALRNSRFGWRMTLASDSPRAGVAIGISPTVWRVGVITIGCGLGALAGSLEAFQAGGVAPESFTFDLAMYFFVAAVVGGSITGSFWGSALVILVPVAFRSSEELSMAIFGAVVIASLFLLPRDLSALDVLPRLRRKRKGRTDATVPPSPAKPLVDSAA
ncbi:ABC transporter permease [Actinoplanes bogorensis]|uniref:ABC transporter permease n=1 Tax=Paractinoplanes bogorensis TaxID=1610840 RepID=A0ABS5YUQ5_9ACTN|nr:ABC transporter permease [Actinoplanes bogorensis]MBU2667181.1 ABC transporter permease [Actinoplanes bogorensis]